MVYGGAFVCYDKGNKMAKIKRALITGITGQDGSYLTEFLLEKGYDYRTIQKIIRVSAPTITSVNTARKYGSEGYKKLIAKIIREEKLISFFEETVEKLLSIPSELEKGSGTWSYLREQVKKKKWKNNKAF